MVRRQISISVPGDLHARLEEYRTTLNVSEICRVALENKLAELDEERKAMETTPGTPWLDALIKDRNEKKESSRREEERQRIESEVFQAKNHQFFWRLTEVIDSGIKEFNSKVGGDLIKVPSCTDEEVVLISEGRAYVRCLLDRSRRVLVLVSDFGRGNRVPENREFQLGIDEEKNLIVLAENRKVEEKDITRLFFEPLFKHVLS